MQQNLKDSIEKQRQALIEMLSDSMGRAASHIAAIMGDRDRIEALLDEEMLEMKYCKHLYVLDEHCRQIVSNVLADGGRDHSHFDRDRTTRPYMLESVAGARFSMSDAYISKNKRRPSLTAVHRIEDEQGALIGYLGADYDLRELPRTQAMYRRASDWQQMKGDPSIRQGLFQQSRTESVFDRNMDEVLAMMTELIVRQGVFHGKLHFSSSRATIWLMDEPYCYQVLAADEVLNADTCLAYPSRSYPEEAVLPEELISPILEQFRMLRYADENIYLRSGSINIMNGMVGLNFSCDGTHYMMFDEFLDKDLSFWFGITSGTGASTCT